jgi:tetratricopeptide (TPR) repeat protein
MSRTAKIGRMTARIVFIAALFLSGILSAGPPVVSAGIIGRDPIREVSVIKSQNDAILRLKTDLPESRGSLVIVSGQDLIPGVFMPLFRSGELKRLLVVLPIERGLLPEELETLKKSWENYGTTAEDLKSLHLDNGVVRGTFLGKPFSYAPVTNIPDGDGVTLVAIDIAFPVALFLDEVRTPIVELPIRLVRTLEKRKVEARRVHLWDSTGRGDISLEYGFIPRLLADLVKNPESALSGDSGEKWATLGEAEHARFFVQYPEAEALYRKYLSYDPKDPSACYKMAFLSSRTEGIDASLEWVAKAVDLDAAYADAYQDLAVYAFKKGLIEDTEKVLVAGLKKLPENGVLATSLVEALIAKAKEADDAGEKKRAEAYLLRASQVPHADQGMRAHAKELLDRRGTVVAP